MNCKDCGTEMTVMILSSFCPNDCDRKPTKDIPSEKVTDGILYYVPPPPTRLSIDGTEIAFPFYVVDSFGFSSYIAATIEGEYTKAITYRYSGGMLGYLIQPVTTVVLRENK